MSDDQQPFRPYFRKANHFAALNNAKQEITKRKDLFSMTLTAFTLNEGENMNNQLNDHTEQQFMIDLVFKPIEPGLKLRPAETQLLLAYMGEILKEIEEEEKVIADEQTVGG